MAARPGATGDSPRPPEEQRGAFSAPSPSSQPLPEVRGAPLLLAPPRRRGGTGRGGRLCFPSPHGYLRLVFKADSGRLAQATAAECPVGIAVRRAWGPVVTFLPFGGWGCQEQGQDCEPRARLHRRPHPVTVSAAALHHARTSQRSWGGNRSGAGPPASSGTPGTPVGLI